MIGDEFLEPGARIEYLRSTGALAGDPAACRANTSDVVAVLPGHAENVADEHFLVALKAGVKVVGVGNPRDSAAGAFTWSTDTGAWVLDKADVTFKNLRLLLNGAAATGGNAVAGPIGGGAIQVTARGVSIEDCFMVLGTGPSNYVEDFILLDTGGDAFTFARNVCVTTGASGGTSGSDPQTAISALVIEDNGVEYVGGGTADTCIGVTALVTFGLVRRNTITNRKAASTACIDVGDGDASSGVIAYNYLATLNNGVATAQGLIFDGATTQNMRCFENYSVDEPGKSGVLTPAVVVD